ncbi:FlgD immunoglobulin-like domain containing protein [Sulfurimonas sp. C5]|uniref:FlgD immunoglobulin-like domain containing protein n=1 Tax=Sulfurimonas sp. C5 TaxID=3036947 RepID=UPI002454F592|nr:FlgD immunoglobulin-like domain containing protein [Sulfurimonas sp. C5]MDH4944853.1 FlgD immunoglobulin-like domain containing protein [Sulfurimonas sp. C5]
MAINAYGENVATYGTVADTTAAVENKTALGKDDFMKLLLVQLQYQDPTEPMDTEKILTQTSQLAALEASDNTKTALENLTKSLGNAQQFSTIAAIGKTADLGSDAIAHDKGSTSTFEVYFPNDIQQGVVDISDSNGNVIGSIDVGTNPSGVYSFDWDGMTTAGEAAESGIYHVSARYSDSNGNNQTTRLGAYPIESVRFDQGSTYVKVGSSYVPLDSVVEVY